MRLASRVVRGTASPSFAVTRMRPPVLRPKIRRLAVPGAPMRMPGAEQMV
jgi:hypothetical protein